MHWQSDALTTRLDLIRWHPVAKFAAGVVDTGGKFATGVVDTGGNFAAGVVDTGSQPLAANISANFRKNSKRP